ncbi:MAG: ATP-binding protein [Elusimicrobiota bacterium]
MGTGKQKEKSESVLVVDDEDAERKFAAELLEGEGFRVQRAGSGEDACELIDKRSFDLVVTDTVMRRVSGFDVIRAARKANPETISIAVTSFGSLDSALDALGLGAYSYLQKPYEPSALLHCIQRGLEKQRLTKKLRQRNAALEKLNKELDEKVREATEELRALNHRMLTEMASLQEVDKLKDSFLDNVSHDLKNPLTTMQVSLRMLLDDGMSDPEKVKECVRFAVRGTKHMEYLVAQLVEATRLTSGRMKLDVQPLSISAVLEEAKALIHAQVQEKKMELRFTRDSGCPATLRADHGRLIQILSNLLSNACKFTPSGGTVSLRIWPENSSVNFCVEDTGPGIAEEHLPKIFDRFYQVDSSDKAFRGLGLGLQIARDLVAAHGGKIRAESSPGKGSRFYFSIPQ